MQGAAVGARVGWIARRDRDENARRGAALGLLIGAREQAKVDERRREQDRLRRNYEFEMRVCMAADPANDQPDED